MRDPYETLGVSRNASAVDIKRAYRRLVKEVHPDLHPNDHAMEERFRDVASAYAILGDPDQRTRFDKGLIDASGRSVTRGWRKWQQTTPGDTAPGNDAGGDTAKGAARNIFRDFFRRKPATAGKDVTYELTVSFVTAAVGGRERLTLSDGRTINVSIPPGAVTDQVLRLKGQGFKGMGGGPPGDALVCLTVAPHSHFRRDGHNILLKLPVTLKEAILGASVDTPTIHGTVAMKVPSGASSGQTLRLRRKGIADPETKGWGDQLVTLDVVMPNPPDIALKTLIHGWNPPPNYDPRGDAGF